MAILKNTSINDTGFIKLPVGTTAQRPSSPEPGMTRFNTDSGAVEWYDSTISRWINSDNSLTSPLVIATGGNFIQDISIGRVHHRVHIFSTVGTSTFTVTQGGEVEYLIVAGGGGGGCWVGGGGGGGGVLKGTTSLTAQNYSIVVGDGGNAEFNPGSYGGMPQATNGGNSVAFGLTAVGGGRGGSWTSYPPTSGGSGGGGGHTAFGTGTAGQGFDGARGRADSIDGYPAGGGGGAGGPGQLWSASKSGDGGPGLMSFITAEPKFYGGGGGGGIHGTSTIGNEARQGLGGIGGGGDGDRLRRYIENQDGSTRLNARGYPTGANGLDGTGGGGGASGAGGSWPSRGGRGGSGIVIIRYRS